jgi:hypothetical protein
MSRTAGGQPSGSSEPGSGVFVWSWSYRHLGVVAGRSPATLALIVHLRLVYAASVLDSRVWVGVLQFVCLRAALTAKPPASRGELSAALHTRQRFQSPTANQAGRANSRIAGL